MVNIPSIRNKEYYLDKHIQRESLLMVAQLVISKINWSFIQG